VETTNTNRESPALWDHSYWDNDYWEKVRQRTLKVIACIPQEKFDWRYADGKFSFADIIRHLAAIERYMYAENVQLKPSRYPGHGPELADGPENVMAFFNRLHQESTSIFSRLSPEDLQKKCVTPGGTPITVWNGCAPWWSMKSIIDRRSILTWAYWESLRLPFTG
jgi:hypothetical protein